MKYFKKIDGDRIFLSPICIDDCSAYCSWVNDVDLASKIGIASESIGLASEKEILEKIAKEKCSYAIIKRDDEQLLGNVSLFNINHIHQTSELGIFIGDKSERNKGFGTEAVRLICDYGFSVLNLRNIMLKVFSFNESAITAYRKAGFVDFGRRTKSYFYDNTFHDEIYMELVRNSHP